MSFLQEHLISFSWKRILIALGSSIFVILLVLGGMSVYGYTQNDQVLPGVNINNLPIGGMTKDELHDVLQKQYTKLLDAGIELTFQVEDAHKSIILPVQEVSENYTIDYLQMDLAKNVDGLVLFGKGSNYLQTGWAAIKTRMQKPGVRLNHITVQRAELIELIEEKTKNSELPEENASVKIHSTAPLYYEISEEKTGMTFKPAAVIDDVLAAWGSLSIPSVELVYEEVKPTITAEDVKTIEGRLAFVIEQGDLTIAYVDPQTEIQRTWDITPQVFASWVLVGHVEDNGLAFTFDMPLLQAYIEENIVPAVNKLPQNAKFEVAESGKVESFQGSRPGVSVNVEKTAEDVLYTFLQRSWHEEGIVSTVNLQTTQEEPLVKMRELNDRGISEVLGVGVSIYRGSPANRINNIANAVRKINGILLAPGEEFSTVAYTKPYTIAGGYLPELVIKGDEVKAEIGGGLCQMSTTLFRMAMNSGLEITMRRPHGLMVSYYNDLTNGLPGTDATIYDPLPDFRFKNDTGNHVLIQAQMDASTSRLILTAWGTNDGRKGWYEPPTLHRWIPAGPTIYRETTDLPPGETKCQHAYTGAEASFTYSRILPSGEKEETLFESLYRAVPETCLVGVEAKVIPEEGVAEPPIEGEVIPEDEGVALIVE
ncbi:VanW family protein [Patescibacteria group bacterium]|nr:VanW family protein [Patescibacteria group bacterium]